MAASYRAVFDLALQYPDVEERICFGTPSLHVGKKLLARLREDGETLAIKCDPAEREQYYELAPDTFYITDHYRNSALILVDLPSVRWEMMPAMVEKAWRLVASRRQLAAFDAARAAG